MSIRRLAVPLVTLFLLPTPAFADAGVGALEGRVVIGSARVPAAFATVMVLGTRRGAQTDEGGHFGIANVPAGPQTVRVHLVGHESLTIPVEVSAGKIVEGLEFVLSAPAGVPARPAVSPRGDALGTIEGRVIDAWKRPVASASVAVLGSGTEVRADDQGRFTLTGVSRGQQTFRARAPALATFTDSLYVLPGKNIGFTIMMSPLNNRPGEIFMPAERPVVAPGDLVAEVLPVRSPIKVYELPTFRLRIWNRSAHPVVLVRCKEWAAEGTSPRATLDLSAPYDAFASERGPGIGQKTTGEYDVFPRDFVEVRPGEFFEPFDHSEVRPDLGGSLPVRPGHYGVTFRYTTTESDLIRWTRWVPDAQLLALLAKVPAVDLEAKATFKVNF
jgi:hypothetical protein